MRKRQTTAHWAIISILLVAAVLRLGAFQEALIGADQASILAAAADIADLRDFPGVGIKSSVGVMQTATIAYLAAIPLLMVRRVIAVRWFFSVLDILAIACLFRSVRQTFGLCAALIAALLYATNPWVVEFNRWIWYQTLIPTFATFAFAALLPALNPDRRRSRGTIPLAMVSATLMGLVHLAALPWAAVLGLVAFAIIVRRGWWRSGLLGVILCLLIVAPYLNFLRQGGIADVGIMLNGEPPTASTTTWNVATYQLTLELLSGQQILTTPHNSLWADSVLWLGGLTKIVPALLLLSIVWAITRLATRRRPLSTQAELVLILGWTLLAPTLFVRSDVHLQYFYLLSVFPAPFVLIGTAVEAWWGTGRPSGYHAWRRAAAIAAVTLLVLLTSWWSYLWMVRIGYEQQGQLRASTRAWLMDTTVDTIGEYLEAHPDGEIIIVTHFNAGGLSPFDWIRNFLNTDRVRAVPSEGGLIIPSAETCYMLADRADPQRLAPLGDGAVPQPGMTIPASPPWTFTCVGPRAETPPAQATWENGLSLLSTEIGGEFAAGGQLELALTWHYTAATGEEYHLFNHLMRDGELVAQVDGEPIPNRYWRDDDILITYFTLQLPAELPPGEYVLRIGSYTWPELLRTMLIDGTDAYEIGRWSHLTP
ncbi:MAG: hypothetical protein J7M39_08585 [Anaerolineae bacterium]|nr:hypothetical protein [Anaerolineae bacterium]